MRSEVEKIKILREQTGLSFSEIKKALQEAGGDESGALEVLKAHGAVVAGKKSAREAKEGIIDAYIHGTRKVGALLELNCETDFVAKNEEFIKLAREILMQVASMNPADAEELLNQAYIRDQDITVKQLIESHIAKLGENIKVGRFERFSI